MQPITRLLPRSVRGALIRYRRVFVAVCFLMILETLLHIQSFSISRPPEPLDPPFYKGCQEPRVDAPRENATIVMLARNSDLHGAVSSMQSLEYRFNHWFHYPTVFLNDEPWSQEFKDALTRVMSGPVHFEVIDESMWGYPDWIDRKKARRKMDAQEAAGIMYAGKESYHHMCRFNSGMFFDHPALQPYKWYWRVEPDVQFTCEITYDPFVEMAKHKKKYGYTVALWEMGQTAPSLFRKLSHYKKRRGIPTSPLWTAMMDPSYLPWPIRPMMSWSRNRDPHGDLWNMCHFWSNFEIADMDFFRSQEYRDFFEFLDADGGFYYERWGDAPVHSLATALFLKPEELHHFADIGYVHKPFQYCTYSSPDGLVPDLMAIPRGGWGPDLEKRALGCNCVCDTAIKVIHPTCLNRVRGMVQ